VKNFEEASIPDISPEERNRLLKFVVVGGGPTGVEFAAEVADFLREDLRRYYPDLPHHEVQITLLEAGHTILTSFNRVLVEKAMKSLKKQGVELLTDNPVAEVREKDVVLRDGTVMPCGIVVWSTGVGPRPIIRKLTWPKTRQGRLHVDEYLKVKDLDDVWAMGDCAEIEGHPLPATAQVAEQQGRYLAKSFNGDLQNVERKPFAFRFLGMMTYIGNYSTLMDTKMISGTGFIEWFAWRSVYLTRLGSLRNKFQVPYNWLRTLIWGRDVSNF
jgi:NADH:ubiquinone reductase (non-electrogenic)